MTKTKRHKYNERKSQKNHKKTMKLDKHKKHHDKIIENKTPQPIQLLSKEISKFVPEGLIFFNDDREKSYAPTINKQLVTLKSIARSSLYDCNNEKAFKFKEPLEISIPGYIYGHNCFKYDSKEAKKFLLRNLSANKHVNANKIITPIQAQSNCWFNTMFVTFFISDKGRKFFHFFRQLMIEGKQKDGSIIPTKLRDAFALLNFAIESSLTGNNYAYELDTNYIIHNIYKAIPKNYKYLDNYIIDVDMPGNPLLYYTSIITFLNNNSIDLIFLRDTDKNWKSTLKEKTDKIKREPHIVVLEIFDGKANDFDNKPFSFKINDKRYKLDSAVIRDTTRQHFCATITIECKQMAYDGMSFHRLVTLDWKNKLNNIDFNWQFEGTNNYDGTPLEWNFRRCYQLLLYYRTD